MGSLINQFLDSRTNHREDRYGGSLENRFRFFREVLTAVLEIWPAERVGARISPNGVFNDMGSEDFRETYLYAAREIGQMNLGYLHIMDGLAFGFHERGNPIMDDRQFRQLLDFYGLSWPGYRKVRKAVKKRITRHMRELGCRSMSGYIGRLEDSGTDFKRCELLLSVSISRFFRDRKLWEVLTDRILPGLIECCGDRLRVWSAGCACGEEVYSLKIVWEQMRLSGSILPQIEITGTDLNPATLRRAKEGKYPRSSLKQVSKRWRESCFRVKRGGRQYWINESLKSGIRWLVLDLFAPPPETGFHLIFIRNNLLTYFQAERLLPALDQILESLAAGGYLVIGSHERLPYEKPALRPSATLPYVFQKKAGNQPIH